MSGECLLLASKLTARGVLLLFNAYSKRVTMGTHQEWGHGSHLSRAALLGPR